MKYVKPIVGIWALLVGAGVSVGCGVVRKSPAVAHTALIAPVYPDRRPEQCKLPMLTAPPARPFTTFAHIVSYANARDGVEGMNRVIRDEACRVGADAVVMLPVLDVEHLNVQNTYPDWVLEQKEGLGGRYPNWIDRKYSLSRRAFALLYDRGPDGQLVE